MADFPEPVSSRLDNIEKSIKEILAELDAIKKQQGAPVKPLLPTLACGLPVRGEVEVTPKTSGDEEDEYKDFCSLMRAWALTALNYRATGFYLDATGMTINRSTSNIMGLAYRLANQPYKDGVHSLRVARPAAVEQWFHRVGTLDELLYGRNSEVETLYCMGPFQFIARPRGDNKQHVTLTLKSKEPASPSTSVKLSWDVQHDCPLDMTYVADAVGYPAKF